MAGAYSMALCNVLRAAGTPDSATQLIATIAAVCQSIAVKLRTEPVTAPMSLQNSFGDTLLSLDVIVDKLISEALGGSESVAAFLSEETPRLTPTTRVSSAPYTVSYDPLDGSSVIASNFAVGSIFAIWPGSTPLGLRVRDLVASVVAVYGPRLTLFVATWRGGVMEFFDSGVGWRLVRSVRSRDLSDTGASEFGEAGNAAAKCLESNSPLVNSIKPKATVFSPGNLRVTNVLPWYRTLVETYTKEGATLRYTGAMVPDVCQIIVRGDGIFMTPVSATHKMKLRLLFEAAPMAFLIECAGGRSTTGVRDMMDVRVETLGQRTAIALGSAWDVKRYESLFKFGAGEDHHNPHESKL
ncbi:Fructose 1 6 bisphosphatase N terminal domain [Trypanosoma vivax]|nr:sedoheptulose-1,7-bisphosphatase [Trypanosoma vivax]KAH8615940.1 Fructose 1 6 bisphosphatase N terminal domain [Trypanosoma vivax]